MNILEQLKLQTKVVADSGDFESMKTFKPFDATTNPSLIYAATQNPKYTYLIDDAIVFAKKQSTSKQIQLTVALDKLFVSFGIEILKFIPGRVSTEVDARFSFDTDGTVTKARKLISLYNDAGITQERILVKIATTWEGIKAASILKREGIHCNMTLLFSLPQAVACAEAELKLVSPFVGRVREWYLKNVGDDQNAAANDRGVMLVNNIYNYYKKFDYETEIMAASFRNVGEIIELAGCDLMTISPKYLAELEHMDEKLEQKLLVENAKESAFERINLDEKLFRWMMNEDAMATEKLAEGIRKFTEDLMALESNIIKSL